MTILIGFEFEFGWKPEIQKDQSIAKKIKKPIYFEQHVYPEVLEDINNNFSNLSHVIQEIKEDSTINFSKKYYHSFYGVEIVTTPIDYQSAIKFLDIFLKWMRQNKKIKTNSTCSLHVNINLSEKEKNEHIDYY